MAILEATAFLLHKIDYKNNANIGYFLSEQHGVLHGLVYGARRAQRGGYTHGIFLFSHLRISYSGNTDLKNIRTVETLASYIPLPKLILSLTYIHELILQLLPHGAECPALFARYQSLLARSVQEDLGFLVALREVELALLEVLGHSLSFERELVSGDLLRADRQYHFYENQGFISESSDMLSPSLSQSGTFAGVDLIAIADQQWSMHTVKVLQRLTRIALDGHLKRPLKSRAIYADLISGSD